MARVYRLRADFGLFTEVFDDPLRSVKWGGHYRDTLFQSCQGIHQVSTVYRLNGEKYLA